MAAGARLFGEKHQKLRPLFRTGADGRRDQIEPETSATPDQLKSRPVELWSDVALTIGPDGAMYILHGAHLLKLARDGRKVWHVDVGDDKNDMDRPRLDGLGNVYLLRWPDGTARLASPAARRREKRTRAGRRRRPCSGSSARDELSCL